MNVTEINALRKEYLSCDSVSRRNEIWEIVEREAQRVFQLLVVNLHRFIEDHDIFSDDCELDDEYNDRSLPCADSEFYDHEKNGVTVSFLTRKTDEDNRYHLSAHTVIPYKYFDFTDADWKNLRKEKVMAKIKYLQSEMKQYEREIDYKKAQIAKCEEKIENLTKELEG